MARPANINKDEIVTIARPLIFARGIANVDMRMIAQHCGISRSSLYRYFESKETIAFQIERDVLREMSEKAFMPDQSTFLNGFDEVSKRLQAMTDTLRANVDLVSFIDDFDRYFSDKYDNAEAVAQTVLDLPLQQNPLEKALIRGMTDNSIKPLANPHFTCFFLLNSILAVAQRVLPRVRQLRREQGYAEEYLDETLRWLLAGIRA